jgi:hypothetical protein
VHAVVVGDVVPVVAQRRGVERQQPECGDPDLVQVVEPLGETAEVTDAVAVAVVERADAQLVDDGVLVPERVAIAGDDGRARAGGCGSGSGHRK